MQESDIQTVKATRATLLPELERRSREAEEAGGPDMRVPFVWDGEDGEAIVFPDIEDLTAWKVTVFQADLG